MKVPKITRRGHVLAGLLLLVPLAAAAAGQPPCTEGKDYSRIEPPPSLPTNTPSSAVQIAEYFLYNSPHCAHVEHELERWHKTVQQHSTHFVRISAVLGPRREIMTRAYHSPQLRGWRNA